MLHEPDEIPVYKACLKITTQSETGGLDAGLLCQQLQLQHQPLPVLDSSFCSHLMKMKLC